MRTGRRAAFVVVPIALAAAAGVVAGARWNAPEPPRDDTAHVVLQRPEGKPLVAAAVRDGNLLLRPLSWECGLPAVFGTHAEAQPDGAFCRVAVEAVNTGGEQRTFDAMQQALTDTAGRRYAPDPSAMAVRRQPLSVDLGGRQRLWLELWFDVPRSAVVDAVRLRGDDAPPAYQALSPAPRTPGGVRFALAD